MSWQIVCDQRKPRTADHSVSKIALTAISLFYLATAASAANAADLLRGERSAFLRMNADSPVDWVPWGQEAIARAKTDNKPVFLFIGSFTSELAGAMRNQTFANPKVAEWLNRKFVCVMVDREEHPEVAALYHSYVESQKQLDGWPLNLWLTPEFLPIDGATYLSPSEDWGSPGFLMRAGQVEATWSAHPTACRKQAAHAASTLVTPPRANSPVWSRPGAVARLAAAAGAWRASFDSERGGFGDPPKFPEPELLRFFLRQPASDRELAVRTLRAMAASSMRDPLDGGFFRYSTDAGWLVPYPQKLLSDQARIALAFIDGSRGPEARSFELAARGALDYALNRLAKSDGTFASAQDATGDKYSGYFSWSEAEINAVLGPDSGAFKRAHGVKPDGNVPPSEDPSGLFSHRNLLRSDPGVAPGQGPAARLLAVRDRRPAPPVDDRATAGSHGLLLSALARAGAQFREPRYLQAARRTLESVRRGFLNPGDGTLRRLSDSPYPAGPEDYAALAAGCRDFANATHDPEAEALSRRLLATLDRLYYEPIGGSYYAAPAALGPGLFARPVASEDSPSAVSLALLAGDAHATAIAAALSDSLSETNPQAPGSDLLALTLFSRATAPK
jgi:hypothetical protein